MSYSKKGWKLQSLLFLTYFFILLSVSGILLIYYIASESSKIKNNVFQSLSYKDANISMILDDEVKSLDTVAQNISYSNLIRKNFAMYLAAEESYYSTKNPTETYKIVQNSKALIDMLTAIIGPNQPVSQIYLYSFNQESFGVGLDTNTTNINLSDFSWYNHFMNSEYKRLIHCNEDSRLSRYYTYKNGAYCLSLCTMYYNEFNVPQGIIEVCNPLSSFIKRVEGLGSLYNENVYVYDSYGSLIYPFDKTSVSNEEPNNYYDLIKNSSQQNNYEGICNYIVSENHYIFYTKSDFTNYTSVISVSKKDLLAPIATYIKNSIVILLIITFIILTLSYFIAKLISAPINKIYDEIKSFDVSTMAIANIKTYPDMNFYIIEMDALYSALIAMQKKAILSMEREVTLHNQEMQSRMLALQSQMNPHFLYNSLATIQSMADENMNEEVIALCLTISKILRYISSDKKLLVPLKEDLEHMKNYLSCMKVRYQDDLNFSISIPESMYHLQVPKLCLQLIVENSIKYATSAVHAPWFITVSGIMTDSFWEITITDNGSGFSSEVLDTLNEKFKNINDTGLLPSLELDGMGLLNIYIRFRILYKGKQHFKIGNIDTGGAFVTIGGDYDK